MGADVERPHVFLEDPVSAAAIFARSSSEIGSEREDMESLKRLFSRWALEVTPLSHSGVGRSDLSGNALRFLGAVGREELGFVTHFGAGFCGGGGLVAFNLALVVACLTILGEG